nr:MAG TPA: Helicase REPLICATION [Caudoviricetes sp.]
MEQTHLLEILQHIDPAVLDYQDWVNVGMALKAEGYDCDAWDDWSRSDGARYHPGDCARKWKTFRGSATPVTGGTIVQLAKEQGWSPCLGGHEIGWGDEISDDLTIIDRSWLESKEVQAPKTWHPAAQLIKYLETLFEAAETVGYVTESWQKEEKFLPTKGDCSRTAGQLIEALSKCKDDIGAVLGDYKPEAGAWIRFNPLDGKGVKNENVTDYRYALVESDTMPIEQQNAIIRELELPVACLVHSGGKSLHAIVHIDASSYDEYRKRVDYLYDVLKKNGFPVDTQNKNPSRLSRMPGVIRNGNKQFLVDTNIGKESWNEWKEWLESVNDDLPDQESLASVWDDLPQLAPCLIENILRQGHKMLLAGPSKAGKSFALIELCIAIAEGKRWLNWKCTQGRVLYVNLELDRASCLHRFKDVYEAMGWAPNYLANIDIWNLRGKSLPMDKLAPKLIRRALKQNYIAVVIDPIYKIITGDENSADQMAAFCNQFDKVCTELGCAVIYCHHHSKGAQGGKKSMDRASGSGVFARDPDALLDIVELELTEEVIKQRENTAAARAYLKWIQESAPNLLEEVSQDDACSAFAMQEIIREHVSRWRFETAQKAADEAKAAIRAVTAWRIEGTLREFPKFPPANLWFRYPVHVLDDSGILGDMAPDSMAPPWQKANRNRRKNADLNRRSKEEEFSDAVANCCAGEPPTVKDLSEWYAGTGKEVKDDTIRKWVKKFGFCLDKNDGKIRKAEDATRDGIEKF